MLSMVVRTVGRISSNSNRNNTNNAAQDNRTACAIEGFRPRVSLIISMKGWFTVLGLNE